MKVAQGEDWFTRWEERVGSEPAIPDAKPSLFIKASTFADQDVPPRQWLVNGLIPANTVTLLSGDGGAGKSLLALQLAMSVAIGHELPWLDRKIDKGTAFYVGAEDDLEEMQRRVNDVSMVNMIDMRTLEDLHLSSLTNRDALLSVVDNKQTLSTPPRSGISSSAQSRRKSLSWSF